MGVLEESEIVTRIKGEGQDYFKHHELGSIMGAEHAYFAKLQEAVRLEPEPPIESIHEHIRAPFPIVSKRFKRMNVSPILPMVVQSVQHSITSFAIMAV